MSWICFDWPRVSWVCRRRRGRPRHIWRRSGGLTPWARTVSGDNAILSHDNLKTTPYLAPLSDAMSKEGGHHGISSIDTESRPRLEPERTRMFGFQAHESHDRSFGRSVQVLKHAKAGRQGYAETGSFLMRKLMNNRRRVVPRLAVFASPPSRSRAAWAVVRGAKLAPRLAEAKSFSKSARRRRQHESV